MLEDLGLEAEEERADLDFMRYSIAKIIGM